MALSFSNLAKLPIEGSDLRPLPDHDSGAVRHQAGTSTHFDFLGLPAEVRYLIYVECFSPSSKQLLPERDGKHAINKDSTKFLRVCRLIYIEAVGALYKCNPSRAFEVHVDHQPDGAFQYLGCHNRWRSQINASRPVLQNLRVVNLFTYKGYAQHPVWYKYCLKFEDASAFLASMPQLRTLFICDTHDVDKHILRLVSIALTVPTKLSTVVFWVSPRDWRDRPPGRTNVSLPLNALVAGAITAGPWQVALDGRTRVYVTKGQEAFDLVQKEVRKHYQPHHFRPNELPLQE